MVSVKSLGAIIPVPVHTDTDNIQPSVVDWLGCFRRMVGIFLLRST